MILIRKLFRDVWLALVVMLLLLFAFQLLWAKVTQRIAGEVLGRFGELGIDVAMLRSIIFTESGKIIQTLMGGETIALERGADMMSIAYVHPLTQLILCVWAIGRAAGALAGEIDRGTMELLLAQPIRRVHVVLAHLAVDALAIPSLALTLWLGTTVGVHLVGLADSNVAQLRVDPMRFWPAALGVMALVFAVSGSTMALSSLGRLRSRVLGLAVLVMLVQFLVNVVSQLWPPMETLRPWTIFYYYQPQEMILKENWMSLSSVWFRLSVLTGIGVVGYVFAACWFCRRDLPAPL